MKRFLLLCASLLAAAACSPNPDQIVRAQKSEPTQLEEQPLAPPSQWSCEDGRALTATFYGDRVSIAIVNGEVRTLPAVIAASGEAYEADGVRFHAKGLEAYLQEGDRITNCSTTEEH